MTLIARVRRKLSVHSPFELVFGWMLARRLTTHGVVAVRPGFPKPRVINGGGEIHTGNIIVEPGVRLEVLRGGRVELETGAYLNRNVHILAEELVHIGRNVRIGWDTIIMDTDVHSISGRPRTAPVIIEDGAWIGCRAIVLKGVRIGASAIVGAGAVVTRDVPAGATVVGPAASLARRDAELEDQRVLRLNA